MNEDRGETRPAPASWLAVAIAWILVGIPMLWGIYMTIRKAAPLFQ
jgi:hypothetical protein